MDSGNKNISDVHAICIAARELALRVDGSAHHVIDSRRSFFTEYAFTRMRQSLNYSLVTTDSGIIYITFGVVDFLSYH